MSTKKIPIIIDTDPGIDDAAAIAAAIFEDGLDVRLITTVAGNVSVEKTTQNALKLMTLFNKDIPVAQGAFKPLTRELQDASDIHGESGMDGHPFPAPNRKALTIHAVEAMRQVILESEEPITLVPIGPLTNIALLLMLYPECKKNIKQIVLMGGSAGRGNQTPNAEFNIFVDPEAAHWVFTSNIPLVMCGLDVTHQARITPEIIAELREKSRVGEILHNMFSHYRGGTAQLGWAMHDFCAIAYLVKPELFETVETFVAIETEGRFTAGTTAVDLKNKLKQPANTTVCMGINVEGFRRCFVDMLSKAN